MPSSPLRRNSSPATCDDMAAAAALRVAADADDTEGWTLLGHALGPKRTITIPTPPVPSVDPEGAPGAAPDPAPALGPAPGCGDAARDTTSVWGLHGGEGSDAAAVATGGPRRSGGGGGVAGVTVSQQRCFLEAVRRQETADGWNNLGNTLAVHGEQIRVGDAAYTAVECYCKAVELRPECAFSWGNIGAILAMAGPNERCWAVDFKRLEEDRRRQADAAAVAAVAAVADASPSAADDREASETRPSSDAENRIVGNAHDATTACRSDGCAAAEHCGGAGAPAVGAEIRRRETGGPMAAAAAAAAVVPRREYGAQECFVRAVELDCSQSDAWYDLGETLRVGDTVRVNGREMSSVACFAISRRLNSKE